VDTKTLEVVHGVRNHEGIARARRSLETDGYVYTNDAALGLPSHLHRHIDAQFFERSTLGPEVAGVPPRDRLRTRDVVEYRRKSGSLVLREHSTNDMRAVADSAGAREYKRVLTLDDPMLVAWMSTLLMLIPPEEQLTSGVIGMNFVRTFTDLVGWKHQDGEEFSCVYVTAREGGGACTSLHPIDDPDETLFDVVLMPGDWLVFRDRDFKHGASPLEPRSEGEKPHRDAIVALVHYAESRPGAASKSNTLEH